MVGKMKVINQLNFKKFSGPALSRRVPKFSFCEIFKNFGLISNF